MTTTNPVETFKTYPIWAYVPMSFNKGDGADLSGTVQARYAAKFPAIQTFPEIVNEAIQSTHPAGFLWWSDASQVELRTAAVESGEPYLISVYQDPKRSLHAETAALVFGPEVLLEPDFKKGVKYACGKESNFAIQYGATPATVRQRCLKRVGFDMGVETSEHLVRTIRDSRPVLCAWQDYIVEKASREQKLTIPFIGISRYFLGPANLTIEEYRSTMLNFPIQAAAAIATREVQHALSRRFRGTRIRQCLNIHDAIVLDCPPRTETLVRRHFDDAILEVSTTGFWGRLCELRGNHVPLVYEHLLFYRQGQP